LLFRASQVRLSVPAKKTEHSDTLWLKWCADWPAATGKE
jgi:hypothetical protein